METSSQGIFLIKHFESFRATAYQDQAGVWTIGYGTTVIDGVPVLAGQFCTEEQALKLLAKDLKRFEKAVTKLTNGPFGSVTKQHEFDALVSFTYNVGDGAFQVSTLRKRLNARLPVFEKNFTDWNKIRINGVLTPSKGLIRRRKAEFALFSSNTLRFDF